MVNIYLSGTTVTDKNELEGWHVLTLLSHDGCVDLLSFVDSRESFAEAVSE